MPARVKLKGIDGGPHKRWSMWFNSMVREVSSARAVRCWVKSRNERNPYRLLPSGDAGHSGGTAGDKPEEGGDDVKSSWPLCPGLHTCYNGRHRAKRGREAERSAKKRPQSGSESETRLREVGIASNRASARRGEYVPGPCTHRPSHHPSGVRPKPAVQPQGGRCLECARSRQSNRKGDAVEGSLREGGEVVTR